MSIITSIFLAIGGLILIIFNQKISNSMYEIQRPAYKSMFSKVIDLEKSWFRRIYKWAVILGGIILLFMAYASYFGPINY